MHSVPGGLDYTWRCPPKPPNSARPLSVDPPSLGRRIPDSGSTGHYINSVTSVLLCCDPGSSFVHFPTHVDEHLTGPAHQLPITVFKHRHIGTDIVKGKLCISPAATDTLLSHWTTSAPLLAGRSSTTVQPPRYRQPLTPHHISSCLSILGRHTVYKELVSLCTRPCTFGQTFLHQHVLPPNRFDLAHLTS